LCPGVNCIVGRNAQGKTNLVEAVNLLSAGKSFRTSRTQELIQWGEREASVMADVQLRSGFNAFGLILREKGKEAYVNHQRLSSISELVGRMLCVTFSPTDLSLIKGSPELRRRFIDRHAVDLNPGLMQQILAYYRALKHKSSVLRGQAASPAMLAPWNELMVQAAKPLWEARWGMLQRLQEKANAFYQRFSEADGTLELGLKSSAVKSEGDIQERQIREYFEKNIPREIAYKSCLAGPHRDDVVIRIGGKEARAYASQGQTRSVVLALKLGVIALLEETRGEMPIVLLDDVSSELDKERSDALNKMIFGAGRQVFITDTDASVQEIGKESQHALFRIEDGRVEGG
jgi:DNA replication and repair protein RecF